MTGRGTDTGQQTARQDSALPARPCSPSAGRHQPPRQHPNAADDDQADLITYVSKMASEAPPLSSEQRDQLALILRAQRRTYDR